MREFWVRTTGGNDSKDGLSYANAKKTINGVKAVLASPPAKNVIYIEEGTYDESTDFSSYNVDLIGWPSLACNGNADGVVLTKSSGSADILLLSRQSSISGVEIYTQDSEQVGLWVTGDLQHVVRLTNVTIDVVSSGSAGLVVEGATLITSRVMLRALPLADLTDSILFYIESPGGAQYISDVLFAFDSQAAGNTFPETRIWNDNVGGSTMIVPFNNSYVDYDLVGGAVREILTAPNTYPSQAAVKDARPVISWGGFKLNPLIKLYTRTVEDDSSEVANEATLTTASNKVDDAKKGIAALTTINLGQE